jgi:hypothetical protein
MGAVCIKGKKKITEPNSQTRMHAKEGLEKTPEYDSTQVLFALTKNKAVHSDHMKEKEIDEDRFPSFRKDTSPHDVYITMNDKTGKSLSNFDAGRNMLETGKRDEQMSNHLKDDILQGNSITSFVLDEPTIGQLRASKKVDDNPEGDLESMLKVDRIEGTC